ncbi:MAG: multicopper oxidase domain-containing protein, partial [Gammaproteobacteria bacterium]|nr:multicopper oxidase domain-containing protein [Gammaproteobacteria bacterium]
MERRDFLKAGLGGVAASYFSSALMLATPKRAEAAVVEFFFTAQEVLKTVTNNKQILTWQFVDPLTTPLGNLTSNIIVNQGDTVIVHVTNALPSTVINFKVPGLLDESATVEPGQTQAYEFVATQAGSYVYYDENNGLIGRAMGLAGPLVVMPQDGSAALYDNAPPEHQFARQYTLLFQEMDSRINDAVTAGLTPDMSTFQPEFFFVNGLSYPNTVYDATGAIDDSKVI